MTGRAPGAHSTAQAHTPLRRTRLLESLPKAGVGAEVGVWKGDFSARILQVLEPRRLYLIDPWEHRVESGYEGALYGGDETDAASRVEGVYRSVLERFDAQIASGQVVVMRKRSGDAAAQLADESLDWVYIDGDHTYEAVLADLRTFQRIVKPGGKLAGDDYGEAGWWEDGVTRAVDEFAASGACGEPTIVGSQFLFTKPGPPAGGAQPNAS